MFHAGWMNARTARFGKLSLAALAAALLPLSHVADAAARPAPAPPPVAAEPAPPPPPATTLEKIRATGAIAIGYRTDSSPLSYRDEAGSARGFVVDVCRKIVADIRTELGLAELTEHWVAVTTDGGLGDVEQGRVDLLCTGRAATLTARKQAAFSLPVFPGGIAALLRADAPERLRSVLEERPPPYQPLWRGTAPQTLDHRTFSAVANTAAMTWLGGRIAKFQINATVAPVDSDSAGVVRVLDHSTDVLFGDRAVLLAGAKSSASAGDLVVLTRHYTFEPLALGMKRGDEDFRLTVDRALTHLYMSPAFGDVYTTTFGKPDPDTIAFYRASAVPE